MNWYRDLQLSIALWLLLIVEWLARRSGRD